MIYKHELVWKNIWVICMRRYYYNISEPEKSLLDTSFLEGIDSWGYTRGEVEKEIRAKADEL